jgi:hypothetical protein
MGITNLDTSILRSAKRKFSFFFCLDNTQKIVFKILSLRFRPSQFYITIIQHDATVRGQFYFTTALLYIFRVLSTPIIRSTITVSTASGTGHTSVQLPSSNVAEF